MEVAHDSSDDKEEVEEEVEQGRGQADDDNENSRVQPALKEEEEKKEEDAGVKEHDEAFLDIQNSLLWWLNGVVGKFAMEVLVLLSLPSL